VTVVLNVGLLAFLSKHFATRSPVVLGAIVTFICQLIDTLVFVWLGFGAERNLDLTSMFIGQFSVKFSAYLLMYFPLYFIIHACKKWIGVEGRKSSGKQRTKSILRPV
jgi:uncharacterized PurR-regulated membrane protein YhhQ (DUF165 family)